VLYAPPAAIRAEVARILESYGRGPGHVFNLGHGVQPGVDPERVAALVAAVADLSPQYHR
jgi:uroporphyrinogen decarboxylase